ncbi:hypothetical protein HE1_01166 [Holospora elegans E1]|uniref:Uncharacterized protein n=2 Tax=Holospora TaxID=44747 RepID=A0A023DZ73_9PROT|nr:hypothetical protein HE1_01166 [Holospora elegans E1]
MRKVLSSNNSDLVKQILKTTNLKKIVPNLDDAHFDFLLRGFLTSGNSDFFDLVFQSVNLEKRINALEEYYFPRLLENALSSTNVDLGKRVLDAMNFQKIQYHLGSSCLDSLIRETMKSSSPLSLRALSRLNLKRIVEEFDDGSLCCLLTEIVTARNFNSANYAAQSINIRKRVSRLSGVNFVDFLRDGSFTF